MARIGEVTLNRENRILARGKPAQQSTSPLVNIGGDLASQSISASSSGSGRDPVREARPNLPELGAGFVPGSGALAPDPDFSTTKHDRSQELIDLLASLKGSVGNLAAEFNPGTLTFKPKWRFATGQNSLVELLQAQAAGTGGVSPAALMLQQAQDQNLRQQMAMAASVSGRALPAVQRQILEQQAMGGQQAARESAILRAQEQLESQKLLETALASGRAGDLRAEEGELRASIASEELQAKKARLAQEALIAKAQEEGARLKTTGSVLGQDASVDAALQGVQATKDIAEAKLKAGVGPSITDLLKDPSLLGKTTDASTLGSLVAMLGLGK